MKTTVNLAAVGIGPILTVNDVAASVDFYQKLGFSVGQRWEDGDKLVGAELHSGDARITVTQDDFAKGRDRQKGVGFRLWIVTNEDLDGLHSAIKNAGLDPGKPPEVLDEEGPRFFSLRDPDGFLVSIAENA